MQSRRTFIRNLALAIPAYSFASVLLSSCGTKENSPRKKHQKIGIIGAGISGLHAAWLLQTEYGLDVEILEASDKIGGRILSAENVFSMGNVELGADEIYGSDNLWYQTVKSVSSLKNSSENATYFSNSQSYSQSQMSSDGDYQAMQVRLEQLSKNQVSSDISVAGFMEQVRVPERVQFIFKGKTEQFLGTSIDRASSLYNGSESLGKIDIAKYRSNASFEDILTRQYGSVLPNILNNTQVVNIDYSGEKVKVTDTLQVIREYDQVIVTVPLSILKLKANQAYGIGFTPVLPESKINAMDKLGMDSGVRVLLQVNKAFWQSGSQSLFVEGKIGKYDILKSDAANGKYLLSATVHGENAEALNDMSEYEIAQMIKAEWKEQIGEEASRTIQQYKVVYWGKSSFIQGSFSYHKVGGSIESREELAKSINNKIFFAGEACNTSNNSGTVHGAMETAVNAVKSIARISA